MRARIPRGSGFRLGFMEDKSMPSPWCWMYTWGLPKHGPFSWDPYHKDCSILGSISWDPLFVETCIFTWTILLETKRVEVTTAFKYDLLQLYSIPFGLPWDLGAQQISRIFCG